MFKGKSHLKCRIGITIITEKLFIHWMYELKELKNKVKELFIHYFKHSIDEELIKEDAEEYFDIIPKKRKRIEEK